MDEIRDLLSEEIKGEIEELKTLKAGSEEKSKAVEDLNKLCRLVNDGTKIETERIDTENRMEIERTKIDDAKESEEIQRKDRTRDLLANVGLQAGIAIGGWIAYSIWLRKGFKYEETGVVGSPWTRNLISKMFPKK